MNDFIFDVCRVAHLACAWASRRVQAAQRRNVVVLLALAPIHRRIFRLGNLLFVIAQAAHARSIAK